MMVRKIVLLLVAALLAVALALPLVPVPAKANPGSQTWYLTDFASGVNYRMIVGSGNGISNSLSISAGTSYVWVAASSSSADEASNIVCRMSGTWSVTLLAKGSSGSGTRTLQVDVGVFSGGTFASKGLATQTVTTNWVTYTLSVITASHTVNPGQYLAVKVTATGSRAIQLDVHNTSGNSPCWATSPSTADDYPGMVNISFTLSDYGSPGIDFGSLNPGVIDQPADQNPPTQGAVTLTVGAETNVPINIQLRGTNFTSGGNSIAVTNVKYNNTNSPSGASTLTTSYVTWYSVSAYTASVVQCYHWITVPAAQTAGDYTATFYYQAVPQ